MRADQALATSIPRLLAEAAQQHLEQPALWRWTEGCFQPVTYRALLMAAHEVGLKLREKGAGPNRRVALAIADRFSWAIAYLGVLDCGATVVPIDPMLKPGEIDMIWTEAEVSLVLHDGKIEIGDWKSHPGTIPLKEVWPRLDGSAHERLPDVPDIDPESLAMIIFTSGTTGQTKGVMLSHGNLVADILGIQHMGLCCSGDTLLSILPIHHAFECTAGFLYPLSIGAQVAYARSLKSGEILSDLKTTRATVILAVPLLFDNIVNSIKRGIAEAPGLKRWLMNTLMAASRTGRRLGWRTAGRLFLAPLRRKAGLASIRILVSGGAALPPQVAEFCDTIGIPLVQGYGLTEASPVVAVNRPGQHRYDTVGPPIPGVQVRAVDPRPDGIGEIAVSGPIVMKGYWKQPEATAAVMRDGWLLTGDMGSVDATGHVRISGRCKNVIITGAGKNVYPEEVEAQLGMRPEILEAVVYGKTRPGKIGETVSAIVVPNPDWFATTRPEVWSDDVAVKTILLDAVRTACDDLASYKRVVEIDVRREVFERTASRKIIRYIAIPPGANGQRLLDSGRAT